MLARPPSLAAALAFVVVLPLGCDDGAKKDPERTKEGKSPAKSEADEQKAEEPVPDPKALAKPAKKVEAKGEILE